MRAQAAHVEPAVRRLCYLRAGQVDGPIGNLAGLRFCDRTDESVGTFDGVLLDAEARRVMFFVVQADAPSASRRYLLPVESAVTLEADQGEERLVAHTDHLELLPFDPQQVRPYSEEEALAALFAD